MGEYALDTFVFCAYCAISNFDGFFLFRYTQVKAVQLNIGERIIPKLTENVVNRYKTIIMNSNLPFIARESRRDFPSINKILI